MSPTPAAGSLFKRPLIPLTEMMYRFLAPAERSAGINRAVREDASLVESPTEASSTGCRFTHKRYFCCLLPRHLTEPQPQTQQELFRRKTGFYKLIQQRVTLCVTTGVSFPPASPGSSPRRRRRHSGSHGSPVLSAQLITAPTGRPREMRNFAPEEPPRPAGREED